MADNDRWMNDAKDAVLLLIAHQSGLSQLVRDVEQTTFPYISE